MGILEDADFSDNIETAEMIYDLKNSHFMRVTYVDSSNIYEYETIVTKRSINTSVYDKDMLYLTYYQDNAKYYININPKWD